MGRTKRQQKLEELVTPSGKDSAEQEEEGPPMRTAEGPSAGPTLRSTKKRNAGAAVTLDTRPVKQQRDQAGKAGPEGGEEAKGPDDQAASDAAQVPAAAYKGQQEKAMQPQAEAEGKGAQQDTEEEAKLADKELPENTVEQGRVFFMYKPKVTAADSSQAVQSLNDVQRFYMLLQPQQPAGGRCRLVVVGKKRLPDPAKHERFFAFVEAVGDSPDELTPGLVESAYTTKTRGERMQPAARAAGEAMYVIAKGGRRGGVHLGYKLELPQHPGEAQAVLGIKDEGSFALSVKNPEMKGRAGVPSAGPPPAYSEAQREQFNKRSWIGVEDASLLDVQGSELLLVGAKDDPIETGELGPGGELLQELSQSEDEELRELNQEGQQQHLQALLEPAVKEGQRPNGSGGEGGGANESEEGGTAKGKVSLGQAGEAPLPVKPAVTGELE